MKLTQHFGIPYLDGSEKAFQIIEASQKQAEAVDKALAQHGALPPNLETLQVAQRLSALEERSRADRDLPLATANRVNRITPPSAGAYHPLPWEQSTIVGKGIQHVNGSNKFKFDTAGYYLIQYQAVLGGADQLALQLTDKAGKEITAAGLTSTGGWITVTLTWPIHVDVGDEINTKYRVKGSTTIPVEPANTFVAIIGLRAD